MGGTTTLLVSKSTLIRPTGSLVIGDERPLILAARRGVNAPFLPRPPRTAQFIARRRPKKPPQAALVSLLDTLGPISRFLDGRQRCEASEKCGEWKVGGFRRPVLGRLLSIALPIKLFFAWGALM